jgi:hypothetical protein
MNFRPFSFLFFTILIIFTSCLKKSGESFKNDLIQFNLKGKVKKIIEINYSESGKYTTTIFFNEDGFISEQSSFNPDGSLIRRWKYDYDNQNRKLTRRCYVLNDSLSYTISYYYNKHDSLVSTKQVNGKSSLGPHSIISYDNKQHRINETFWDQKSTMETQINYIYSKDGMIIEETHLDSVLHQTWKQLYNYNTQGLKDEITYVSLQGKLINRIKYKYDNEIIKEVCFYNSENKLVNTTNYSYNKEGDISETIENDLIQKKLIKHTFEYKYDKHGNWISLTGRLNENVEILMTRKLEYFE